MHEWQGEFSLVDIRKDARSRRALRRASTSLSQLADGITYYSCLTIRYVYYNSQYSIWGRSITCPAVCGPRGIRTLDLLNAIEARSQLRYGPWSDGYSTL